MEILTVDNKNHMDLVYLARFYFRCTREREKNKQNVYEQKL